MKMVEDERFRGSELENQEKMKWRRKMVYGSLNMRSDVVI